MNYSTTRKACYAGYVVQAIVNNLAPLLFIVFQTRYDLPVEKLGRLVLLNFGVQLFTDVLAVRYLARLGYRGPMVAAHVMAFLGLVLLAVAPAVLPSPYMGLCLAIVIYAVGGGLLEVMVSPLVEALPSPKEHKAAAMSLLHSFYCWGQVAVVIGSTLLLLATGHEGWVLLPLVWSLVPLANLFVCLKAPMPEAIPEEHRTSLRSLFRMPVFMAILVLMLCAGAAELTISQWSSFFAEQGLGLSKMWGDLAGPCLFAVLMGCGRFAYGLIGQRVPLVPALITCGLLGIVCYLTAALSPSSVLSLAGCAVCGLSVSLLWPGTFSLAAARFPMGGTAMFALLAVLGDLGCAVGPWIAGWVADSATTSSGALGRLMLWLPEDGGSGLRIGILAGIIFPVGIVLGTLFLRSRRKG